LILCRYVLNGLAFTSANPVKVSKHIIWFLPAGVGTFLYLAIPLQKHETEQDPLPAENARAPAINEIEASTNDPLAFNSNQQPQIVPDPAALPHAPAPLLQQQALSADEVALPMPTLILDTNTFDPDSITVSGGRISGGVSVTLPGKSPEELDWMRHHQHRVFLNGRLITVGFTTESDLQGNSRKILLVFENREKAEEIAAEMRAMKQKIINHPGPE
jgi:hypothetical protein